MADRLLRTLALALAGIVAAPLALAAATLNIARSLPLTAAGAAAAAAAIWLIAMLARRRRTTVSETRWLRHGSASEWGAVATRPLALEAVLALPENRSSLAALLAAVGDPSPDVARAALRRLATLAGARKRRCCGSFC